MSDEKPTCYGCNQTIEGEVVWYRPFGKMDPTTARGTRFTAQASNERMENSRPFHPACFEKWTGQKWPPE